MKPTAAHSFPDAEVVRWSLSSDLLEVEVSDVHFDGQLRGPAKLVFPLLHLATAMSYDQNSNEWTREPSVERLKNICEFHHKMETRYSLKGFGSQSGRWIAVSVLSRDAQITW